MRPERTITAPRERDTEHLQGHWVLAKAGKRVLRPGGRELTERMLAAANPRRRRVVELAPGLGLTAARILDLDPASYTAVEQDADAAATVRTVIGERGRLIEGDAASIGLPDGGADLVVGEAMLTMHSDRGKRAILEEVRRVLAPGGRYAIHELALRPDTVAQSIKDDVRRSLAQAIKVNARPLTVREWRDLFEDEGFVVDWYDTAEMALLEPRRLIADEGPAGVARMMSRLARDADLRRRVLTMRASFSTHRERLCAVALVVTRPGPRIEARASA